MLHKKSQGARLGAYLLVPSGLSAYLHTLHPQSITLDIREGLPTHVHTTDIPLLYYLCYYYVT